RSPHRAHGAPPQRRRATTPPGTRPGGRCGARQPGREPRRRTHRAAPPRSRAHRRRPRGSGTGRSPTGARTARSRRARPRPTGWSGRGARESRGTWRRSSEVLDGLEVARRVYDLHGRGLHDGAVAGAVVLGVSVRLGGLVDRVDIGLLSPVLLGVGHGRICEFPPELDGEHLLFVDRVVPEVDQILVREVVAFCDRLDGNEVLAVLRGEVVDGVGEVVGEVPGLLLVLILRLVLAGGDL